MKWPPKRTDAPPHALDSPKLLRDQTNSRSAVPQHDVYAHKLAVAGGLSGKHPLQLAGETSRGGSVLKTRPVEECSAGKGHYKPIATFFKHGGFNYRQIAREGDVAIYEQRSRDSENVCCEVVRIRRHEARTFPSGKSSPAREAYPTSEAWGVDGFTLTDRDAAFAKLREICLATTLPPTSAKP
jgi:hypothetical protein